MQQQPSGIPGSFTVPVNDDNGAYSISWTTISNTSTYELQERIGSGSWTTIQNTSATSRSISGKGNNTYGYRVRACNDLGCSGYTSEQTVDVAIIPGVPSSISAPATHNGNFTVSWGTASGSITKYDLDQSKDGGSYTNAYDGTATSKAFTGLADGTYVYRVRACRTTGSYTSCSGWKTSSNSVAVNIPGVPTMSAPASNTTGNYSISWTSISNATSYKWSQGIGSSWGSETTSTSTSANISVTSDAAYLYRVRACNAAGCSAYSSTKTTNVAIAPVIDTPPTPQLASIPTPSSTIDQTRTLLGEFNVTPGGQATYTVPIMTAPGTAGLVPNVSLNYSSGGGNGIAGLGWSLSAYGAISRCRQTDGQDRNATAITWSASDRFCFNGDRLLVQTGTYGTPGSTYKTEIDSFARITAVGGITGHPSYFKVEHKNGIIEYYGNSTDSRYKLDTSNTNTVLSWAINRREDSAGNPIVFSYHNDTSGQRIATIQYAYGSSTSSYSAHIAFEYESRADPQIGYVAGYQTKSTQRLKEITSYNNNQIIREYIVTYNQGSAVTTNDQLSRISELKECIGSVCSIATGFEWELLDTEFNSARPVFDFQTDGVENVATGDINGDGIQDILWGSKETWGSLHGYFWGPDYLYYALGAENSSGDIVYTKRAFTSGSLALPFADQGSGVNEYSKQFNLEDINGDGRSDLVYRRSSTIKVHLSTPQSDGSWQISSSSINWSGAVVSGPMYQLGDVNGDGLVDVIYATDADVPGTMAKISFSLNQDRTGALPESNQFYAFSNKIEFKHVLPNGSNPVPLPDGDSVTYSDLAYAPIYRLRKFQGDFNGDGQVDIIADAVAHADCTQGMEEFYCIVTAVPTLYTVHMIKGGQPELRYFAQFPNSYWGGLGKDINLLVVDVNNDGLNDVVTGPGWRVHLSDGKTLRSPIELNLTNNGVHSQPQFVDLNQDGYGDVVWQDKTADINNYTGVSRTGMGAIKVRYWNPQASNFDSPVSLRNEPYEIIGDYFIHGVTHTQHLKYDYKFSDVNSDGTLDLVRSPLITEGDYRVNVVKNQNSTANKIVVIDNGLGLQQSIYYEPMSRTEHYSHIGGISTSTTTETRCGTVIYNEFDENEYEVEECWEVQVGSTDTSDFYENINIPWHDLDPKEQSLKPVTPVLEAFGSMQIVTRVDQRSPSGNPGTDAWQQVDDNALASTSYFYEQMKMQAGGRGSLGFKRVTAFNHASGVRSTTEYRQDWPFIGNPGSNHVYARNGAVISEEHIYWGFVDCYDANGNAIASCVTGKATTQTSQGSAALGPVQLLPRESVKRTYSIENNGSTPGTLVSETETKALNDDYGNTVKVEEVIKGTDEFDNEETVLTKNTVSQYEYNPATWSTQNGRLQNLQVTTYNDAYGTLERESSFSYYYSGTSVGLLQTETLEPNLSAYTRTTTHVYDSFGNRTQSSIVAEGQTRKSKVAFDSKGRYEDKVYKYLTNGANPTSGTEVLSSEVISRDKFGTPAEVRTHVDSDSHIRTLVATTTLGAPYFTADSTGTYAVTNMGTGTDPYNICSSHARTWKEVSHAGGGKELVCFDLASRPIREASLSFDGIEWTLVDTEYDSLGRELRKSVPYFKSEGLPVGMWNQSLNYDELNRPGILLSPAREQDGEIPQITIAFTGSSKIITNHKNQQRTEIVNALGQIVKVIDPIDGETEFAYDSRGNMRVMEDPNDNSTTVVYDLRDRKISMTDPDKGTWQYRYNAFDELTCQQDAKAQTITQTYDVAGRIFSRTDRKPGGTCESPSGVVENYTQWVYDTAANGWGQLSSEWSSDTVGGSQKFNRSYSYDGFGRPSQTATTFANYSGSMETHYEKVTYDQFGRVFQTFDAARQGQDFTKDGVKNIYNTAGYLAEVVDAASRNGAHDSYYRAEEVDARGNVTQAFYGNGVEQLNTFWVDNGLAKNSSAITVMAEHLQHTDYYWDEVNNLESRNETGGGTWTHMYARERNIVENFTYDDLNRLNTYVTSGDFVANESVTYDAIDNIRSKTGKGNYFYGSECTQGAGPHAVCRISGTQTINLTYDSNGNLTSDTTARSLSYTVFDKPNEIIKGANKTEFLYGPDRSRYQRKDTQGTNVITTAYIGGVEKIHYSSTNTREWKRTVAGVARLTRKFSSTGTVTNETHYLHYDHLGSISLITDDIGFAVEDFYFDPWGQSRKPADTVPTNNTGSWALTMPFLKADAPITSRGFTGHEMLDEVGLIHMNGRIYDAAIGRFVQADPLIQDPLRVQSLNRYSYVWNNPLNATDPSGFATQCTQDADGRGEHCNTTSESGAPEVTAGKGSCSSQSCQNYKVTVSDGKGGTTTGYVSINKSDRDTVENAIAGGSMGGGQTVFVASGSASRLGLGNARENETPHKPSVGGTNKTIGLDPGAPIDRGSAPAEVDLSHLDPQFQALWNKSFPNGNSLEHGGTIVESAKTGAEYLVNEGAGTSGSFSPNMTPPSSSFVSTGVFHTHPYDASEGSHTDVSLSGGDAAWAINNGLKVIIAQSGASQFMFMRTMKTPTSVNFAAVDNWANARRKTLMNTKNLSYSDATRKVASELAKQHGMAYYEGTNGIFKLVP